MRKLYLSMLMAVGLLISGNAWAEDEQAQIGTTKYATLTDAIDAVPTNGTPTEIQLIANIESEITSGNAYAIADNKNVVLDLNGHSIKVTATNNANTSAIANAGTLEVKDSKTGGLIWLKSCVKDNHGAATILNVNNLTITSGTIQNATVTSNGASYYIAYAIDNNVEWKSATGYHTQWHDITCTINGGHIISYNSEDGYFVPAIRLYDQCHENNVTLTMNGGIVEGQRGIYIQKAGRDASKDQIKVYINDGTIIGHGNTSNGDRPWAIDVEADANSPKTAFDAVEIKIEDGTIDGKISLGRKTNGTELGCEKLDIKGGNFTYHNVILNGHINDFYEGCPNTLVGCVSGGKFFFDPNVGELIRTPYVTEIQFASDWGGDYAKGYDEFNKYYGDLANKAGWVALGYTVEKIQTPEGKEGDWYAIVKYTASTEDYKNFLKYIKEGYMAVDITGTAEGRTEGVWPDKTITIGEITQKEMSGTQDWTSGMTDETNAVTIADGANITIPAGTTVEAYSVNVTNGTLNIGEGATLIVGAGGVIEGATISINIGGENGSGAIKISPDATTNNQPRVRVQLTTKAHVDGEGNYHWQYFARPTYITPESFTVVKPQNANKHYIRGYVGETDSYVNITNPDEFENYEGYAITNNSTNGGVVYQFEGKLNANQNAKIKFKNNGFSLMGNSYLAPVSVEGLFKGIIEGVTAPEAPATAPVAFKAPMEEGGNAVEWTIWIYNCANERFEQTNLLQAMAKKKQLQPMQGFFMKLREGSSLNAAIDYVGAVWNNNNAQAGPILAPAHDYNGMGIASIVVSANGCTDQIDLFEDAEFDNTFNNGADASKLMNLQGMFNLYAQTEAGTLSCVASDNIEGTILTFQANNASEYELSFSDVENMNYSLIDLSNGEIVEMNEGNVYHFNAIPNSTEARFQIVTTAKAPTAMDKVVNTKVVKGIYSMTGAYLGEAKDFNALPQGVYVVNGEKIVK